MSEPYAPEPCRCGTGLNCISASCRNRNCEPYVLGDAMIAVRRYLATRKPMEGIDPEVIHVADRQALRVSDIKVILRAAELVDHAAKKADDWCNCQAIPGTSNYPGPWHERGGEPHYPCAKGE